MSERDWAKETLEALADPKTWEAGTTHGRFQIFTMPDVKPWEWAKRGLDALVGRDHQQWEAALKQAAMAICPTCAAGDVPRPHSKHGSWFHIGVEGEEKQCVGCHAAPIYELASSAAQPAEEGKS